MFWLGRCNGFNVPLVYMLATDKQEATYKYLLTILKDIQPALNPTDVTLDFEKATMNAIVEEFPNAEIHGCNFHFGQNVWRHVQAVGLQTVYANDDDFAQNIKLLTALAFVPTDRVVDAFEELMTTDFYSENSTSKHRDAIQQLATYFQNTYMYRVTRMGKQEEALYPPRLWNVFDATLCGKYITATNISLFRRMLHSKNFFKYEISRSCGNFQYFNSFTHKK